MGFYDGQGLTTRASAWELADTLALPVLLVVQPKGQASPLPPSCGAYAVPHAQPYRGHSAQRLLRSFVQNAAPDAGSETGLPVVGYLPHLPECAIESRHLGLKTAGEIVDLQQKLGQAGRCPCAGLGTAGGVDRPPCPGCAAACHTVRTRRPHCRGAG